MPGPGAGPAIASPPGLEIRPITPEEQRDFVTATRRSFGAAMPTDEDLASSKDTFEFERTLAVFDAGEIVGTAGIFSFEMTVPGGRLACGGVTRVGVATTHRRRGLLTALMRRQLDGMHERGEPLAGLYASEAKIYGRFGYGLGTYHAELEVDRSRAAFAKPPPSGGRIALLDLPQAVEAFTQVWDKARLDQPGMLALDQRWWRLWLSDTEHNREGASPHYRVVYRAGTEAQGLALYRIKMAWNASGPDGTLYLNALVASTPEAYAALWRYVLDVDLIARVSAEMRPVDEPLRFLLADARQPRTRVEDGIWLRLVDVKRALAGRRYATDARLILQVRDRFCPWNDGRYEILGSPSGAECRECDNDPDLAIDVADLAAVYLGGNHFRQLFEAGRVEELRPGALVRADAMFATDRAPWCPSHF